MAVRFDKRMCRTPLEKENMPRQGKQGINPGGNLSTQEVATILGLSHPTLLKLLKEKKIPEPQVQGNAGNGTAPTSNTRSW